MEACKARGAKWQRPCRSPRAVPLSLIRPAADKLAARLAELTLNAPKIPVINNVDVAIETDPARIKGCVDPPGVQPGTLGGDHPEDGGHWRHHRCRMRPW